MFRRLRPSAPDAAADAPVDARPGEQDALDELTPVAEPGLAALPIAGITRRRTAAVVSGILAAWIVIVFARQVSEASAATASVEGIAEANTTLRAQVAMLERELDRIGRQRYIEQQARGYGLGSPREIAFTLAQDAPPLPDDAPGSAAVRVGAATNTMTPLERWLTVLFGPSD
jgi:cell division protein FtsB